MQKSFDRWLLTLAMLVIFAGAIGYFVKSNRAAPQQKLKPAGTESTAFESDDFHPYYLSSVPRPTNGQPESVVGFEKLPRAKVEAWLVKQHRDAVSLLAAFRALDDTNYLNEAATNFPNNPQVELAVLAHDEFPTDRRKWLDLFKASSPSNSLANYLSAQNYFKNGNADAAVQELLAASGKSQFGNYAVESELEGAELARFCGESPGEGSRMALAGFVINELPEMTTLKQLANGIADLQTQETAAGNTVSVQKLTQMGMVLGNQLIDGGGGNLMVNQLVGIADEYIVLSQLDPNTGYDFLGGQTPKQVIQELGQRKISMGLIEQSFISIAPNMTDDEMASYYERVKIYGDIEAMKWVVQQHPPGNP